MPDEVFGDLISFADVEFAVLDHYRTWINTWLAARERSQGITVGTISRPRSYVVKQTFTALPGEEQTPIVIAVCDGFTAEPARRGSGRYDSLLRFGIAAVCMGSAEGQARLLCGHYQAALLGIAIRQRNVQDMAMLHDFVNLRIEDIEEEASGRSLAAVRLELVYKVPGLISEGPIPELLPDVVPPQPDEPLVEEVFVETETYQANEVLP